MKIIEGMKKIKHLCEKCDDLRKKIAMHCADLDFETPVYGNEADQSKQIAEWLQSHTDTVQEIARLRLAIQRTNINTKTTIELGGKAITKTLAEWIHWRRDLAKSQEQLWSALTDRNLREGSVQTSSGGLKEVRIRRYFAPRVRDEMVALYKSEPTLIDAHMEVVNAVTDLLE